MADSIKVKELPAANEVRGEPEENEAGTAPGVTTSGVRSVGGGGTAGGTTATAQVLALDDDTRKMLRQHLLEFGIRPWELEEVMQRVRLALLRRVTNLGPPDDPDPYLRKVAETEALGFRKEQRRHPVLPDADGEVEVAAPSSRQGVFQKVLRAERLRLLARGFAKLSDADATIIALVHFEGLKQKEIAERLGISLSAVEKRYERAIARLQDLVRCDCTKDDLEEGAE